MQGQRYRAFRVGITKHWTIKDRNRNVFLFWAWAEDEATANALARAFNTIDQLAGGEVTQPNPVPTSEKTSRHIWHHAGGRFGIGEVAPAADAYRPQSRIGKLEEYTRKAAPESERRLIARLRLMG